MRTIIITNLTREVIDIGTRESPHNSIPGNTVIEAITNTMYPAPATIEMKVTTDKPIDSFKEAEAFIGNLFEGGR